jgi:hypothetical protein
MAAHNHSVAVGLWVSIEVSSAQARRPYSAAGASRGPLHPHSRTALTAARRPDMPEYVRICSTLSAGLSRCTSIAVDREASDASCVPQTAQAS